MNFGKVGLLNMNGKRRLFSLECLPIGFIDIARNPEKYLPLELINSTKVGDQVMSTLAALKFKEHLYYEGGSSLFKDKGYFLDMELSMVNLIDVNAFTFSIQQDDSDRESVVDFAFALHFIFNSFISDYYAIDTQVINLDGRDSGYSLDYWYHWNGDINDDWDIVVNTKTKNEHGFFASLYGRKTYELSQVLRRSLIREIKVIDGNRVLFKSTGRDYEMSLC